MSTPTGTSTTFGIATLPCSSRRQGQDSLTAWPILTSSRNSAFSPKANVQIHYEKAAQALAQAQVCLEINSSGLHKPIGEIYPSAAFLRACLARGVAVTINSDAHKPTEVARDFPKVKELLRETGCREGGLVHPPPKDLAAPDILEPAGQVRRARFRGWLFQAFQEGFSASPRDPPWPHHRSQ